MMNEKGRLTVALDEIRIMEKATYHVVERTMERAHMDDAEALEFIGMAASRGKTSEEMMSGNARLSRYMKTLSRSMDGGASKALYFGSYLLIVSPDDTKLTLYTTPLELRQQRRDGVRRHRPSRCALQCMSYEDEDCALSFPDNVKETI